MDSQLPPLKSWQFYHSCRKILGRTFLQKLFQRSQTQIYRWSRDPDFCEDVERNPLDRMQILLERLCEIGREDIAQSAVAMLAHIVGCELRCTDPVHPDKENLEAECLDDYPPVNEFHQAASHGESPEVVRYLYQKAKRELDETYEMYCREKVHK